MRVYALWARFFMFFSAAALSSLLYAEPLTIPTVEPVVELDDKYVANLERHTPDELYSAFLKADGLLESADTYPEFEPVVFVLHGDEANIFVRNNYRKYKNMVDLAARLDAFGVIDIKICEYWMSANDVERRDFPAFVETIPYGPTEEIRLVEEGYIYF